MHPFVRGEIACGSLRDRKSILELLQDLPEAVVAELRATVEENPKLVIEVDVEAQLVQIAGMGTFEFELNPFWKACLINGLDQVGYTLRFDEQIKAFEATHPLYAVAAAG